MNLLKKIIFWIQKIRRPKWNNTQVYNHGYVVGYNQSLVDKGYLEQKKANGVASKFNQQRKDRMWC